MIQNMRTLSTQVRLRRLIRAFGEAQMRLSDTPDRAVLNTQVDRLQALAGDVHHSWRRERLAGRPALALEAFVMESLRTVELAIAGLAQEGSDHQLLMQDFDGAALPLEVFLRGLDGEPALERSA